MSPTKIIDWAFPDHSIIYCYYSLVVSIAMFKWFLSSSNLYACMRIIHQPKLWSKFVTNNNTIYKTSINGSNKSVTIHMNTILRYSCTNRAALSSSAASPKPSSSCINSPIINWNPNNLTEQNNQNFQGSNNLMDPKEFHQPWTLFCFCMDLQKPQL